MANLFLSVCVIISGLFLARFHLSSCEVYSSMSDIRRLVNVVKNVTIEDLETLKKLRKKQTSNTTINCLLEKLNNLMEGINDPNFTPHHPINAYKFIYNASVIYNETVTPFIKEVRRIGKDRNKKTKSYGNDFPPSDEDVKGILEGFVRLHATYNLKASEMADGNFGGILSGQKLTGNKNVCINNKRIATSVALECSNLMVLAFEHYDRTLIPLDWLNLSLERVANGDNSTTAVDIYSKAAQTLMKFGFAEEAARIYKKVMDLVPNNKRHRKKWESYKSLMSTKKSKWKMYPKDSWKYSHDTLCQGKKLDKLEGKTSDDSFVCKLIYNHHPLLMFHPVKIEQLSRDPYIVVFYNVFSKREMRLLKSNARSKLKRSAIRQGDGKGVDPKRTSKSVFLKMDSIKDTMERKVGALTGLISGGDSFESIQIANYGVGGQYYIHADFAPAKYSLLDNRLATFMTYLSNVESGGATVFPFIGKAVFPEEGKAVFWYNLYRNGTGNSNTRHAACPVLVGDKWVANYWIHMKEQEFRRPCSLDQFDTQWS